MTLEEFEKKAVKKDEWFIKSYKCFNVSIVHWVNKYNPFNEHNWCLYVTIFNEHPLYEKAQQNTKDYDLDLGNEIYPNFHAGCTFYNKQIDYVKIGCDYQHLGDEYFGRCSELPNEILADAKELYDWFENYEGGIRK